MSNEQVVRDIMARIDATTADLSEAQQAKVRAIAGEVIPELVTAEVAKRMAAAEFKPEPAASNDDILAGTPYGRRLVTTTNGTRRRMTPGDIQFLGALTESARMIGRGHGPKEQLRNLLGNLVKREDEEYGREAEAEWERAMDTAESGYGQQLIGAQYVSTLWDAARAQSPIMSLFNSFDMTAPTAYLPVAGAPAEPILAAENTANNSSEYGTTKTGSNRVTVTAKKLLLHQMWSGELEEDSIIPFVAFLQDNAAFSLGHYMGDLIMNGDDTNAGTGNINSDDADPADTKYFLAFDGIRHGALVDATGQGVSVAAALSWNDLTRRAKALMIDRTYFVDWGMPVNAADLIYACEPETALYIGQMDEVKKARETAPGRALLPGELGQIIGHPVISNIALTKTDTDGKYTTTTPATNDVRGQVCVFNRNAYVLGWRRRVKVVVEPVRGRDQTEITYSWRVGLGRYTPTGAASGIKSVALLYNVVLP